MSIENKKTLEIYNQKALEYIESGLILEKLNPEKTRRKKDKLENLIKNSFSSLPVGAKVFEIGSSDGKQAKYMSDLGFNVTASSTAESFIIESKKLCPNTIKFDAIEDQFPEKYNGILCWRVFVHFTIEDSEIVIKKVYNSLEENGIFIFNAMNREDKGKDNEWVDFEGAYHIGADRYYNYYNKKDLDDIILKNGFKIINFYKEGGENNNEWFVYVLKKQL